MSNTIIETVNPRHNNKQGLGATRFQKGLALLLISGVLLIAILLLSGLAKMDLSVFSRMTLAVKIHAGSAIMALVLGAAQFALPKGRTLHIIMGSLWVAAMISVAVSSLFIKQIFAGSFSPIHLFVPLTAWGLYAGLKPLFGGKKGEHGKQMRGVYFGALFFAGLFAFLPSRTMWNLFLGG
ncbi:MAG: DUF2306 domain-containing protein [Robiginitomaculum sp.]|nr:DUF2306 domain-containing protein [Robiginitomaculum sp.]